MFVFFQRWFDFFHWGLFFFQRNLVVVFSQGLFVFFFNRAVFFDLARQCVPLSCQRVVFLLLANGLCGFLAKGLRLFSCQRLVFFLKLVFFSSCVGLCFLISARDCVFCLLQGLVFFSSCKGFCFFLLQGVEFFLHNELCFAFFPGGVVFFFSLQGFCFFLSKGSCVFLFLARVCVFSLQEVLFCFLQRSLFFMHFLQRFELFFASVFGVCFF